VADAHKTSEHLVAWAAGLFEGEGCIVVTTGRNGTPRVVVTLGTTDRDVLERFVSVVGIGSIRSQKDNQHTRRPLFVWAVSGRRAKPIIELFLPWLGVRRESKAQDALATIARMMIANGEKTHCAQGHPYSNENTRHMNGHRHCRACEHVWNRRRRIA